MTGLNFAGGSEFAAVGLWQKPLPVLLIVGVTFMINTRHILMGAAFAPYIRHLPPRRLFPALFLMTDESWAMAMADIRRRKEAGLSAFSLHYYMGVSLTLYVVWVAASAAGAAVGPVLGDVSAWGFGMAFPRRVSGAAARDVEGLEARAAVVCEFGGGGFGVPRGRRGVVCAGGGGGGAADGVFYG